MLFGKVSFGCSRGCGEWLEIDQLRDIDVADLGYVDGRTASTTFCPVCHRRLEVRIWSNAMYELCSAHGIWLEVGRRTAFHQRLAATVDGERAIREVAALFETTHGRRELARRILALEAQALRLQKKLDEE
jgi:hypothetical protein